VNKSSHLSASKFQTLHDQ